MAPTPASPVNPSGSEARDSVEALLDTPAAGARAIRGAGLRGSSYVIGGLLALASAPLLVRHLGVVDFGRYTTVLSLVALAGGLTEAGIGPIGVREYSVLPKVERDRFMANLIGLRIALGTLGVSGAAVFAVVAGYGAEMVAGTLVAGLALVVITIQGTFAVPLYATLRIGRQVVAELLSQLAAVILVITLVLASAGLVPFLAIPVVTGLGLLIATVRFVRGSMPLVPAFQLGRWRGVLRETLPVGAAIAMQTLYFRTVIVVMSLIALDQETGYFATSYRIIEVLLGIPGILVGTAFPLLARAARSEGTRLQYGLQRLFEAGVVAGMWMMLATIVGTELALSVVAGEQGRPTEPVLRIQAVVILFAFLSATWSFSLLSLRKHRELILAAALAVVVTLALALALVPAHGAIGGAVAAAVGEASLTVALLMQLLRAQPNLRPRLGVLPRVLLAASLASVAALVPDLPDLVRLLVLTGVYFGALAAVGGIPKELVHALLAPLRGRPSTRR